MQWFYDGQIRRYLTQTIRVFSNFTVKYGDGTLHRIPVMYGDPDRQVASIIRQNSENSVNSVPRIAVYVSGLALDRERLSDSTFVSKMHFRERDFDAESYTQTQGRNYTVERLMPTPFKLSMKVDIWSANTDQKLQILEQILILFTPSLELQTTDNYIDWTSLTVLNLNDVNWSSRSVPQGNDTAIDVATLTVDTPIWISPPVKVKHLGVITNIITSIYEGWSESPSGYIDGLGVDLAGPTTTLSGILSSDRVTITNYNIQVYNGQAVLLGPNESVVPGEIELEIPVRQGTPINWIDILDQYPGKYVAGSSKLFLIQPNGTEIIGTVAVNPLDPTILTVSWDPDTLTTNTDIVTGSRPNSPGTFDAIINPLNYNPKRPNKDLTDQPITVGLRFLIIEDIGSSINSDGPDAWKGTGGEELIAHANDIIEWDGSRWVVIFDSVQESDRMVWQTNIYTGIQYLWNGISWSKSFEGEYGAGLWRLEL